MKLFDLLLRDLPFSRAELFKLIRTAHHRYKVYGIRKRSGNGMRVIAQPSPEIKLIQRWIVEHVLSKYPVHSSAMAYRKGIGIADNARKHVRHQFLLKMDFKDFFPSITADDFAAHTKIYAPEWYEDMPILAHTLFRKPRGAAVLRLSIGAPSSPAVSNTIVYALDVALSESAASNSITYTRYADDLVFSTNKNGVLREMHQLVKNICNQTSYPKLTLNFDKTIFSSKKWNRTVTGLVLSNDQTVSIGWERKRALRSQIYRYLSKGLTAEEVAHLRGYLSFVRDVEPALFEKLKAKMPADRLDDLFG